VIPGETLPPVGQPVDPADPVPSNSDVRKKFRPQSPLKIVDPPAAT